MLIILGRVLHMWSCLVPSDPPHASNDYLQPYHLRGHPNPVQPTFAGRRTQGSSHPSWGVRTCAGPRSPPTGICMVATSL